jgi:hypothetical protein
MAVLTKPASTGVGRIFDLGEQTELPAKGTYIATCLDIRDVFGVERRKFQSEEMEKVDLTAFLFGYRDPAGNPHKIASKAMKISGNEKSALFSFLKSWLGRAPAYGWDYAELKGAKALITIDHEIGRMGDREFANIISISPLPAGMDVQAAAPKAAAKPAVAAPSKPKAPKAAQVHAKKTAEEFGGEVASEEMPF